MADIDHNHAENPEKPVQVLLGCGEFWRFVNGEVVRGEADGPVALQTKLGLVLSGPFGLVSDNDSYIMRVDTVIVDKNDSEIANELKNFWDNE